MRSSITVCLSVHSMIYNIDIALKYSATPMQGCEQAHVVWCLEHVPLECHVQLSKILVRFFSAIVVHFIGKIGIRVLWLLLQS